MEVVVAVALSLGAFGGNVQEYRAAFRAYRIANDGVSTQFRGEERRWQFAMRVSASVWGVVPVALP